MYENEGNSPQAIYFGPFLLKGRSGPLFRNGEEITLRAMPLKMLWYLANRAGEIISKDELFQAIWPDDSVSESSLTVCVTEIRVALEDDSRSPRYLQTIHRTGYRFIGQTLQRSDSDKRFFVGRQSELQLLDREFDHSINQQSRLALVCGNPGLGKSALLDVWANKLGTNANVSVLRARCVEHTGTEEPYSPFIFALREVIHSGDKNLLAKTMQRLAPGWIREFPALSDAASQLELSEQTAPQMDASRLRYELTDLLVGLSQHQPLILVIDDIHWCDTSSAVALSELLRQKRDANLFVIAGCRLADLGNATSAISSVISELKVRHLCTQLNLEPLTGIDVESYVNALLNTQDNPEFSHAIFQRSQGHPLFVSTLVRHVTLRPDATANDIIQALPDSLQTYVTLRLNELTPVERRVLEAASIAGQEFSVEEVQFALNADVNVEAVCESLASRQEFIRQHSYATWPDGTVTGIYRFAHALYPDIVLSSISHARRIRTHSAIAQCLQESHTTDVGSIAAKLAHHYENAGNAVSAAQMLKIAASLATRLHAHNEALSLLQRGLALLQDVEDHPERSAMELEMLLDIGSTQVALTGYASDEVQNTFNKAHMLSQDKELAPHRFGIVRGLAAFYLIRGDYSTALDLGKELLRLELDNTWSPDSAQLEGYMICGVVEFFRGRLTTATSHLQQAISHYDPEQHRSHAAIHGLEPGAVTHAFYALCSWLLGDWQQSLNHSIQSIEYANSSEHPYSLCQCHSLAALLHQWRFDYANTAHHSALAEALATKHGFSYLIASEQTRRGWLAAMEDKDSGGIQDIQEGMTLYKNTGAAGGLTVMAASYAEACLAVGQLEIGLNIVEDALKHADNIDEHLYRAELLRLQGELLNSVGGANKTERSRENFYLAIEHAEQQNARCLHVRATASLAGLMHNEQQESSAFQLLSPVSQEVAVFATSPELSGIKTIALSGQSG